LGTGVLVGALALGSTFAANINLNTDNNVEFGQGVVTAAACDTTVTILPTATYDTNTASSFKVSAVTVKGLGLSTAADGPGCKGKVLRIKAYALNSNTALNWGGGGTSEIKIQLPNTNSMTGGDIIKTANASVTTEANAAYQVSATAKTSDVGQEFTLGGLAYSSTVVRFTIESSDS
jgi:hypothetical protein